MHRKGFPESYDVRKLVAFMADVKAGPSAVHAPVYSHQSATSCRASSRWWIVRTS